MSQTTGYGGGGVILSQTQQVTSNTTIENGTNNVSIGVIDINNGVTVTINSGGEWVII